MAAGGALEELRDQAATWVEANWDLDLTVAEWWERLASSGWGFPTWPTEWFGKGLDNDALAAIDAVFRDQRALGAPGGLGQMMGGPVLMRHGSEDQQRRYLWPLASGAESWCQFFSEPGAGSDLASAQTRAVRDGDEWVINGSKMFTTNAQEADYAFMLTRTNPDVAKHKGLTTFVVPLRQEGVEIRPVYTLSGERTNLTFYNDVRVDDSMRIGEVDGGWDVMTLILTFERTGAQGGWSAALLEAMERWAVAAEDGPTPAEDPGVRARLGRAAAEVEVSRLLARRCAWMQAAGLLPGVEGSMAKLFASEAITRQAGDFVDLLGPDGIRSKGDPSAPAGGAADYAFRFALGTTTYGGTSEVQRNVIAQRGLGLPRPR